VTGDSDPGLCARCAHAALQINARGSRFWRCRLADSDDRFRRYPPLPVLRCDGLRAGEPARGEKP